MFIAKSWQGNQKRALTCFSHEFSPPPKKTQHKSLPSLPAGQKFLVVFYNQLVVFYKRPLPNHKSTPAILQVGKRKCPNGA
jgi:hypothetical protein